MSETSTLLALPRPHVVASSSDDSFTALMNAVLDSARSSGSLESTGSHNTDGTTPSNASDTTTTSVPSLDASGHTASSSSRSSTTDASASESVASSTTPSPCPSILRSSSNLTLPSRTNSPSISFAPLPSIAPRKRNSPHPLGVAARSRLLRHRRMLREHGLNPDEVPYPYGPGSGVMGGPGDTTTGLGWGEEIREAEAGVDAHEDAKAARAQTRTRAMSDPSEADALVSLGRMVKGAGKTLWRSISMKDVRAKDAAKPDAEQPPPLPGTQPSTEEPQEQPPVKTAVHLFDDDTPPPAVEGGVWEEVVEEEGWKKLLSNPPSSPESASARNDTTPRASIERKKSSPGENRKSSSIESKKSPPLERKRSSPSKKPPKRHSTLDIMGTRIR
ncbi:hypothetical protein VTO73DRAFT_13010 [Trametes versicolor]